MNKRIEKLAIQAAGKSFETFATSDFDSQEKIQKFAELIVRECIDVVANADMTELEGPDPEDVLYVACKQIVKHFGVE